jgi:hypothetical protein
MLRNNPSPTDFSLKMPRRSLRVITWVAVPVIAGAAFGLPAIRSRLLDPGTARDPLLCAPIREVPLSIPPVHRPLLPITASEIKKLGNLIAPFPGRENSVSAFLHMLRVHRLDGIFVHERFPSSKKILECLTDEECGRAYFGYPPFVETRNGIQYLPRDGPSTPFGWRENHRDYVLASFAELGLPLSFSITFPHTASCLREVLLDSMANFHLNQEEIQWTALAYSLYMPPANSWVNRFGERNSFDDLARELLSRPYEHASCGGTHQLVACAILARVDQQQPVLSPKDRDSLTEGLQKAARRALMAQCPDGSWYPDWFKEPNLLRAGSAIPADSATLGGRLLVTSHLAEALLYLPSNASVPDQALRLAGVWLYHQLRTASREDLKQNLCPFTHSVRVLQLLSSAPVDGGSGTVGLEGAAASRQ